MQVAQRRARLVVPSVAAAVALMCAACGTPEAESPSTDPSEVSASTTATPTPTPDDRPTVEPPGPLDSRLWGDDILVVSPEPLTDEQVTALTEIEVNGRPGIAASTRMSIGQFALESKTYTVAAVDPGEYRTFLPSTSADLQEQWDRVADGEVAVSDEIANRLPIDDEDYLAVGSGDDVQRIHVGAYGPQAGNVDIVVNEGWGERLGLPEDNALLISTDAISPQAVSERIRKVAPTLSATNLDAVEQYGLDLDATNSVNFVGSFADAVGTYKYTVTSGGGVVPAESWVRSRIVTETVPIIGQVTCNKYMLPQLRAALTEIVAAGLEKEIYQYSGCYVPRFIAGSNQLSNHSFGLALDLNVPDNQRGTVGEMDRVVVAIFKKWGFAWGGDWDYTDPMHFELAKIVNPG